MECVYACEACTDWHMCSRTSTVHAEVDRFQAHQLSGLTGTWCQFPQLLMGWGAQHGGHSQGSNKALCSLQRPKLVQVEGLKSGRQSR